MVPQMANTVSISFDKLPEVILRFYTSKLWKKLVSVI